jgi:hypothetical protein
MKSILKLEAFELRFHLTERPELVRVGTHAEEVDIKMREQTRTHTNAKATRADRFTCVATKAAMGFGLN